MTPPVPSRSLRDVALDRAAETLGRIGPVHCEDPVATDHLANVLERQAVARSGDGPPIRAAILGSVVHGVHEHPFMLVAARDREDAPWSVLDLSGLARRSREDARFVVASAVVVVVGHFTPDERATRAWLRLADGTGDVVARTGDAILVIAAVADPVAASPAHLEYLAADGTTLASEDIEIAR